MNKALVLCGCLLNIPAVAGLPAPGEPGAVQDARYCGEPSRTPAGRIKRSRAALDNFVKVFPCPANLEHTTTCPGWNIDHTIPLASGGCDTPLNMSWLPLATKACSKPYCKDRFERTYHAIPRRVVKLED